MIEHMFGSIVERSVGEGAETDPLATELETAPTEWIEREIGELAAHIAAATCRWLELVAEFDRRNGHEVWGFHSCGAWVAWRCSIDPRSAREHVRVARALRELPAVRERFSRGELSYSKVRAITRIATPQIEAELVEMARLATAAQLERLVRGYRRAVSLESAVAAYQDRFFSTEWDEDGCLCIRGRLACSQPKGRARHRAEILRAAGIWGANGPGAGGDGVAGEGGALARQVIVCPTAGAGVDV